VGCRLPLVKNVQRIAVVDQLQVARDGQPADR
jgi:hypothetical protein